MNAKPESLPTDQLQGSHACLVANSDVWIEGEALRQFERVAAMPNCLRAVAMPDLHPGRGIPVGAVFAFRDAIHPLLIGNDAGCGARVVATSVPAGSLDWIERRVRHQWEEPPIPEVDPETILHAVWHGGPRGLSGIDAAPAGLADIVARANQDGQAAHLPTPSEEIPADLSIDPQALGSIGGGNHFVELARVEEIRDCEIAATWGFRRGCLVVIAHSGSRGLGEALARRWGTAPLVGAAIDEYMAELVGVCRFAQANRLLLAYRALRAIGAARAAKITGGFDVIHNHVSAEPVSGATLWVHRKGAAPAWSQQPTVVLGSRGAPSWILSGTGNESLLCSVAHGAGRRMGRSEAREKLKLRYRRSEVVRSRLGGRVLCKDSALLFEEHPDAYKAIEPIIASIEDAGLATPIASLVPLLTVKL